jgi:hypothetical protein
VDAKINHEKLSAGALISGFLFGAIGGLLGGAGFGTAYYQKSIFSKGGYYLFKGVAYSSLPIFQRELFKSFARSLTSYARDLILGIIQDRL